MQDRLLVIGGSAGSLQVVLSILKQIGLGFPLPVLIVLHRNSIFESSLEDLLYARTHLIIKEVEEKEMLLPGRVYVCPPDYHVLVEQDRTTSLDYSERVNFSRPSIDVTFRSAADVYGPGLIAVLLSGGNADGAEGMEYVQQRGGLTLLQDPQKAEVPYMPQQVLLRINVDRIASADELPSVIHALGHK